MEPAGAERTSSRRQDSRQVHPHRIRLLQSLRRHRPPDAASEDAATTPTLPRNVDLPLPARPACMRGGQRRPQQQPPVPCRPPAGLRTRPDPVYAVVGGPGGGAPEGPRYINLHVRGRHRHSQLGCNNRAGQGPCSESCRCDGGLGAEVEDAAGGQQDASPGPLPTSRRRPRPRDQGGRRVSQGHPTSPSARRDV